MVKTAAAVSLLALAFLAVAWHATKAGDRSVLSGDSFVDSFLRASKNSVLARRGKVKAWHKQIEKGGLFARMHALERHDKAAKKAWRNKALASITEPSSKDMIKQLESMQHAVNRPAPKVEAALKRRSATLSARPTTMAWATHGSRGRTQARPIVSNGAPKEIPQIRRLMASLGHGKERSRGRTAGRVAAASAGASGGAMTTVSSEISKAKAAAKRADAKAKRVEQKLWAKGSAREVKAQDRFSSSMRDTNEAARQHESSIVKRFG